MAAADPQPISPSDEAREHRHRTSLLALASSLGEPLEPDGIALRILDSASEVLGARHALVYVVEPDGRSLRLLVSRSFGPVVAAAWTTIPLDADVPASAAVRTSHMVIHPSAAARAGQFRGLAGSGRPVSAYEASAAVPMIFEGRAVGVMLLGWDGARALDEADRAFLRMLVAQAAQALERARLLAAVRDRDERLQLALAASRTWLWEMDIATEQLVWLPEPGPASSVPTTTRDWLAIINPADGLGIRGAFEDALRGAAPLDVEVKLDLPSGGERWFAAYGRAVPDAHGRPVRLVGSARDITERKMAERELERRLATRAESARLREAFVAVVSHELRTPITTIFGGTRVLASHWRTMDDEGRETLLADVADEADRLYRLTEDIIVLTRAEHGPLDVGDEPVHLGWALDRALVGLRARRPGARFEVRVPGDLPVVRGDEMYLEHVLRNLLDNAAKYGGAGSTAQVTAVAHPETDTVVVRVEDEGPGIDETEAERLFGLFYRSPAVAETVPGAGIGLFVCRRLVEAMGGSIEGHNRPGGGAVFTVRLPLHGSDTDG